MSALPYEQFPGEWDAAADTAPRLTLLITEQEPVLPPTEAGRHRQEHGLCYRTDCVAKFGLPLIMRATVYTTIHG